MNQAATEKVSEKAPDRARPAPRIQAELFESGGISLGSIITEGQDRLIIGSSKRADLVVPHEAVSHIHAMLRVVDEGILLYDLGSERGTFVEGKKIVERRLGPGSCFEIGGHSVKVNLVENAHDDLNTERAVFWRAGGEQSSEHLEVLRVEDGIVREERTLSRNGRVFVGRRRNEILLDGVKAGGRFLHRRDSGSGRTVDCLLPPGYRAEVLDGQNELVRVEENAGATFAFNEKEKVRLITADEAKEFLIFWRPAGDRMGRRTQDADNPALQRTMIICAAAAGLLLTFLSYVPLKKEVVEEAVTPKSSYFRMTMDSSPAPAAEQSAEAPAPAQSDSQPKAAEKTPVSKAASISSSLSKMLSKKSSLTAESIDQAVSNNGSVTTRVGNKNIKSETIASGSIGGGGMNVNAMSAGLSGGAGGQAGSLKGFANGKGTAIGGGSGFGGKGFDMSLGGEEAEAIGGLDKSLIAAVVQANIGQIKHCYERQLIVDPNIFGKVVANWTINGEGAVSATSVKKTTMNNQAVENCILSKIKGWAFPKPKGGGQVIVSYPFLFKSLN